MCNVDYAVYAVQAQSLNRTPGADNGGRACLLLHTEEYLQFIFTIYNLQNTYIHHMRACLPHRGVVDTKAVNAEKVAKLQLDTKV